jgi:signal transduction histidine kinase
VWTVPQAHPLVHARVCVGAYGGEILNAVLANDFYYALMANIESTMAPQNPAARYASKLWQSVKPPEGFTRSSEGKIFFAFCGVLAGLSLILGYVWYDAAVDHFRRDKRDENRTAFELINALITTYANETAGTRPGEVPVPQTFRAEVLNRFNRDRGPDAGLRMQLVGVPGREIKERASDEDAAGTLTTMAAIPTATVHDYFRTGADGMPYLRAVFPQRASTQSCVDCHNRLQANQSPWHIDDLMGALIIDMPMMQILAELRRQAAAVAAMVFLVSCFTAFHFLQMNFRRTAQELEKRSYARLAEAVASLRDHFSLYGPDGRLILTNLSNRADDPKDALQWAKTNDGRWLQIRESVTASKNRVRIESDVTDLKRKEAELRDAVEEAERANRAKSSFLAMMSHELRTPLNAVIGFSEIMRTQMLGPIPARYHEYAEDIHESGLHLLEVINAILDMSKLEAGKAVLAEGLCNLPSMVVRCERLVAERAEAGGIAIETSFPPDLPEVWADEVKLRQILVNLLSNAVKFTRSGGKISVAIKDLGPDETSGGMVIQVADTGIGIAPEDLPIALAPFRQLDNNLDRKYEGTGLGLPLAKGLVELHGGVFHITSAVDVGTTISVHLPASRRRHLPSAA